MSGSSLLSGCSASSSSLLSCLSSIVAVSMVVGSVCRHSGGLILVLTVPLLSTPINTIAELAEYPLPVASFGNTFYKLANQSLDPDIQKIAEDYIVHYNFAEAVENASNSKVVMAESRRFLEYTIRWGQELVSKLTRANSQERLH